MSNLSNIGFILTSQEDLRPLVENTYAKSTVIATAIGNYHVYTDDSNAQIWHQFDKEQNWLAFNPQYKGKSRRKVELTATMSSEEYPMEGSFHGWAVEENAGEYQQVYPFVFETPDYAIFAAIPLPSVVTIQLTAFANELSIFDSLTSFENAQDGEFKMAAQSFIPSGLFSTSEDETSSASKAYGFFAGTIKEWEKKRNTITGNHFYWMLVETLGGEIDIVADERFFEAPPVIGGVVQGNFWLCGQILNAPTEETSASAAPSAKEKKGFFSRLFGK
ncbi:hypothetical protein [Chitinophaga dinghuensis]|nr:hypothetical protein [Chitinophaga dinghuensis]